MPNQTLYGECGVYSIRVEIIKRQLNSTNYQSTLPDTRLVKQAFMCQLDVLRTRHNSWIQDIILFAQEIIYQDITWFLKVAIKGATLHHTHLAFVNGVQNTRCLPYYTDKLSPLRDRN